MNLSKIRLIPTIFLLIVLAGCATPALGLSTPNGSPEVTIQNVTSRQVVDYIAEKMLAGGADIRNQSDYGITVAKKDDSFLAALVYGSRYDSTPEARVKFNVIQEGMNVRVFARATMVTNPGSGFERAHDITSGKARKLQHALEEIKSHFNGAAVQ